MTSDRKSEIQWRYLNDAEFHMRVDLAVIAIEEDEGIKFDGHDRSLATLAACYALQAEDDREVIQQPPPVQIPSWQPVVSPNQCGGGSTSPVCGVCGRPIIVGMMHECGPRITVMNDA